MRNTQYLFPDSSALLVTDRAFARSGLHLSCSNIHTVKAEAEISEYSGLYLRFELRESVQSVRSSLDHVR